MIPTYLSLIIAVGLIVLEAWLNDRKFDINITINKKWRTVLRFVIGAGLAYVTYLDLIYGSRYMVFLIVLFGLLFDPVINIFRKKSIWYLNGTGPIDVFFGGLPKWIRVIVEFTLLFMGFLVWQYDFARCLTTGILESGFWKEVIWCSEMLI